MTFRIDRREFLISSSAAVGLAAATSTPFAAQASRVRVVSLKVDYLNQPLGLDNRRPRFSWGLESDARSVRQSAYRIVVAQSEERARAGRGDLWDSGKIETAKSIGIAYAGRALSSRQRCWWCVQVWDERGQASPLSPASGWEMGLLDPSDWVAQWLEVEDAVTRDDREGGLQWIWGAPSDGKARRFRFKFRLPRGVDGGEFFAVVNDWMWTAQVSGIWIDGVAWRGDPLRASTHRIDLLDLPNLAAQRLALGPMSEGEHVVAVEVRTAPLSNDQVWAFAFFSRFNLSDGNKLRVGSSPTWKTRRSGGQDGDWFTPGYDDGAWDTALPVPMEGYQPWPALPAMHLRRTFSASGAIVKARLYATALGVYEARLNGNRVGDAVLTPEISQYAKRVYYQVYDVGHLLIPGENVFGLTVADGWYAGFDGRFGFGPPPRRVLAQLELTFADGSRQTVATGPGWRTAESALQQSEIRIGETYDARLEQPGWDRTQFDDSHWLEAHVAEAPPCRIEAQKSPPVRVQQTLAAVAVTQPRAGEYVFDFGQNFAGWCRLRVTGTRGSRIELKFGELLNSTGEVNQAFMSIGEPKRDIFILKGDAGGESFEPQFAYRGFRYVQVSGLTTAPRVASLEGIVAHSDLQFTGRLRCGSALIEQIWRNIVWTQRSNFVAISTDCPSREQRGWTGDAGIFWDAAAFNMDVCAFTSRYMDDVVDDQAADGGFPMHAPEPRMGSSEALGSGFAVWADAGIILPWTAWRRYGDVAVIERHWDAMDRYLQFVASHNPNDLWIKPSVGMGNADELDKPDPRRPSMIPAPTTPAELVATAYWAHSADLLAQMAQAVGRREDAARLRAVSGRVRLAFNRAFVKADGTVGSGSQTGYILAIQFGLLPGGLRRVAAEKLVAEIRRCGVSLTTGPVGTAFVLDVLADAGFAALAYDLLLRTAFPSWGYMIASGATTMWEGWSSDDEVNGNIEPNSQNHYWLGSIGGFLFRRAAGINAATPGFETIIIRPVLDPRVKKCGADYDSVMGWISTDWEQNANGGVTLDVTIPANATARIHLPAQRGSRISEGRKEVSDRSDMRIVSRRDREVVLAVGSGSYRFVVAP